MDDADKVGDDADKVIMVAGGDGVFVFRLDQQDTATATQDLLDVRFPAVDASMLVITRRRWDIVREELAKTAPELKIIDMRREGLDD